MRACTRTLSIAVVLFGLARAVSAVEIDWTFVGDPGNPCWQDYLTTNGGCYGAVAYPYLIGTYEITNAQYAEFLNAKAASDPLELYNTRMANYPYWGGITRSGSPGSYSYAPIAGREDMPVNEITFFDALRFVNWLNNGQLNGDTETGAYTLLGGTPIPTNWTTVTRNPEATIFLPSEDEWFKAAHYDSSTGGYFNYPIGSNSVSDCEPPTTTPNRANCRPTYDPPGHLYLQTIVGSYAGSAGPYGTFDQGGNVWEWTEGVEVYEETPERVPRGGSFNTQDFALALWTRWPRDPGYDLNIDTGLRVAPEPGQGLLLGAGIALLCCLRRFRPR
jgi:formylglycine-generating enzyme required for sulfatase activity